MKTIKAVTASFLLAFILGTCTLGNSVNQPNLRGTSWALTAYNQFSPIEGTQVTLKFEAGLVTGNAGCNSYSGSYQVNGEEISFGPIERTEIGCMEPEGVMDQERVYLEILGTAQTFKLADGILKILADQGQILTFQTPSSNQST
jgi:putative lipoprotein